jgi:hypothetical protein
LSFETGIDLTRRAELLNRCPEQLGLQSHGAEQQAEISHQMSVAARLNLLVAFFFRSRR